MQETVLELKNYSVSFDTPDGKVQAVRNVDLTVKKGEILCIVGESGCGKTVMCRSVMKLLPPNAHVKSGEISLCGENITAYKRKKMEKLCGSKVSMVFQDPMLTLNPTIPVGKQITEAIIKNQKVSGDEAKKRAVEMLKLVGIPDAEQRYGLQPHFFSGGMRQRCVLAIALACDPEILFADEATTALDATVEAKILDLLLELREKTGISIVFISHDLGAVARIADRVAVMYAGKIIEIGTAEEVYYDPRHPYTWGLLSSLPVFAGEKGICEAGVTALSISYYNLGYQTGEMAYKILKEGADPGKMAIETDKNPTKLYNKENCDTLGIKIPDGYTEMNDAK